MIPCSSCNRLVQNADATCPFCGKQLRGGAAPLAIALMGMTLGCGPAVGVETEADASSGGTSTSTSGSATSANTTPPGSTSGVDDGSSGGVTTALPPDTSSEGTDTGDTASTGNASAGFIYGSPDSGDPFECSVWEQDCGKGEKCSPWANDGGTAWNATRCTPLAPDPDAVGEPCTVEGSMVTGVDSCVLGASCLEVDEETDQGTCVELCSGSPAAPICDETDNAVCLNEDGRIPLCRASCDPLALECPDANTCIPGTFGWGCIFLATDPAAAGESCDYQNSCTPGLVCLPDDGTCVEGSDCCTEVCDLSAPDPDATCSNDAHTCVPFYEDGEALPGYASVGVCRAPV